MAGLSDTYPVYASVEDLTAYMGGAVADAEQLLARASGVIREATKTAFYRVEDDGWTPKDTIIKNAFHDATILQAAGYSRAGVKPGDLAATQTGGIVSKSLGGRSVTYAQDATIAAAKTALLNGALTPEATFVLSRGGLLTSSVYVGGSGSDYDILLRRWIG